MPGTIRKWILTGDEMNNVDAIALVVGEEQPAIGVGARFSQEKNTGIVTEDKLNELMLVEDMVEKQAKEFFQDVPEERLEYLRRNRLVIAPAMIADRLIMRVDEETGEPYYGYFDAESIRNAQQGFQKFNFIEMFNINHDQDDYVDGVYTAETWIIEDSLTDKAYYYGYNLPVGSWMVTLKFDNEQLYNELVASGQLNGLSVEAYLIEQMLLTRRG